MTLAKAHQILGTHSGDSCEAIQNAHAHRFAELGMSPQQGHEDRGVMHDRQDQARQLNVAMATIMQSFGAPASPTTLDPSPTGIVADDPEALPEHPQPIAGSAEALPSLAASPASPCSVCPKCSGNDVLASFEPPPAIVSLIVGVVIFGVGSSFGLAGILLATVAMAAAQWFISSTLAETRQECRACGHKWEG